MVQNSMYDMHRLFFMQHGVGVNKNGGYYQRGKSYSLSKKLLVPATYLEAKEKSINAGIGYRPNVSQVACECSVSWHYVEKIEGELLSEDHVLAPKDV